MKLNVLPKELISWLNETNRGIDKDFQFRFRGQESGAVLKFFPALIMHILSTVEEVDLEVHTKREFSNTFNN